MVRAATSMPRRLAAASAFFLRIAGLSALAVLSPSCSKKPPPAPADLTPAFWIWHRSSALSAAETSALQKLGAPRLYRQIGEFGWREGRWSARPLASEAPALDSTTTPVVRLDPGFLDKKDAAASLEKWLRYYFSRQLPSSLQLDYDCPARLLPLYGRTLKNLKASLGLQSISATALPSWIEAPAFRQLSGAVDELLPMFYDLTADPAADVAGGKVIPIGGPDALGWVSRWKDCACPWRAGLPNFERLTLFEKDGALSGHLRQWSPEDLAAAHFLQPIPAFTGGAAWRVTRDASLEGTALKKDQFLVWRAPSDDALRQLISASFAAGAHGIVWFALPGPGIRACHTPAHLAALERGESPAPSLSARLDSQGRLTLRNNGPGDLSLTPGAALHRLVLTAERPGLFPATAGPGAFFTLSSASSIPIGYSASVVLSFTGLTSGEQIASDPRLVTPSAGPAKLQWSLDSSAPQPLAAP